MKDENKPLKIVNLYGGPGTGKSTTAAALFADLKYDGYNTEYVQEYAKHLTWENRGKKVFAAQDYIFAKQHFAISRVAEEVDFVITDSPLLLSLIYAPINFYLPSLELVVVEAYERYDNLDIFLRRNKDKKFNPAGRKQNEEEAITLDKAMEQMLSDYLIDYTEMTFNKDNPKAIRKLMVECGWISE